MTFMITRVFWLTFALLNIVIGVIGLALPVMPASPFFILSLISIKKASPETHQRIIQTRPFVWIQRKFPIVEKWLR
jgi:uncharacterized membrane protein YbaN (DUF454 family)